MLGDNPVPLGLIAAEEASGHSVTALILLHMHRCAQLETLESLHAPEKILRAERRLVAEAEKKLADLGFPA